jgi:hypothetical protein
LQVALGGGDDERSIVVWAARNASFHTRSRDIAAAEVEALKSDGHYRVRVLARAATHVQGVEAVRWRYTLRSRVDPSERMVDCVALLRPLRPEPSGSDYYEYSISLHTTPEHHGADVDIFEAVLASLAFSEPEV